MKILITGKNGQVGYELERSLQGLGSIWATDRAELDLSNFDSIRAGISGFKPDLIINAAAYTAVDKAESEPELAMRINAEAPGIIAEEARKVGAMLVHYSTDYVFDGKKAGVYTESDPTNPLNVYGHSKLEGERAIAAAGIPHLIFRTSWVYGTRGKNFLLTISRLAQNASPLRIVSDQYGAPTWCRTIADITSHIVAKGGNAKALKEDFQRWSGIYHLTSQGSTSWYEFACSIVRHLDIEKKPVIEPIAASDYPVPAIRPMNSKLSCELLINTFCGLPDWETGLRLALEK
jgi:dTDP-4-dehydrorhamnose reductase